MLKKRRKFTQCPNCGYTFEHVNNYCPNCGQENHDLNVPIKHLIEEFLEGTLHYDAKFWVTLKYLMFKPGLLTEKFISGKRASFVPPFRLYVFISIIFFFALAISPNTMNVGLNKQATLKELSLDERKNLQRLDSLNLADNPALASPMAEEIKIFGKKIEAAKIDPQLLRDKLIKNISFMMFLLMPLFGYLLYLFHIKMNRNYIEHLMFSIHVHSFYFILFIIYLAFKFFLPETADLFGLLILTLLAYTYLAMLRIYKQPYLKTLIKFIPITFIYLFCITLALLGNLVISVLMS